MPEGIRWNFHLVPSRTIVWPALLPPWKRITRSACSAKRSVIFPLPSSPHWAPTITMPAIARSQSKDRRPRPPAVARRGRRALPERVLVLVARGSGREHEVAVAALVLAEHRQRPAAHLVQPGDRARADLGGQRVVVEVRGQEQRPVVLVARVDDRVELLEHPGRALLGSDVVDVQQVDRAQAVDQLVERVRRLVVVGVAEEGEQSRQRVDRHRAVGLHGGLGDEHRQGRLAGPHIPREPEAAAFVEALADIADVAADLADERGVAAGHREHGLAVERDLAKAARQAPGDGGRPLARHPRGTAAARPRPPAVLVVEEAGAVAAVLGAGRGAQYPSSPA